MLLRGQSNAVLLDMFGAIWQAQAEAERLLGFDGVNDKINVISSYGQGAAHTMHSGTGFLTDWLSPRNGDWQQGWEIGQLEQGLLAAIEAQPETVQDNPTGVVWLHNEYDSQRPGLTTAEWTSAVRFDAAQVRAALGQDASTVPYLFVNAIPYSNSKADSNQAIKQGMAELDRDPAFHATIAAQAGDLDMNYGGAFGDAHIGAQDAATLAHRIAQSYAQTFAIYAKPGSPVANAGGQIDDLGPQVVQAEAVAGQPDQLQLTVAHDVATSLAALDVVAAGGAGWSVASGDSMIWGEAAQLLDANHLLVTFEQPVPAGGILHYSHGYGRISGPDGSGHGHAVYDDHGMPIWTAPEGVAIGGAAAVPAPVLMVPAPAPSPAPAPADVPVVVPAPDTQGAVDWDALAAAVTGNFLATGHWFL